MSPFPKPRAVRASLSEGVHPAGPPPTPPPPPTWDEDDDSPETLDVPTERNVFEAMTEAWNFSCEGGESCRTVSRKDKTDMLWFVQKLHEDMDAISKDDLNRIFPHFLDEVVLVSEDPLTLRYRDEEEDHVLGTHEEDTPYLVYLITLFVYKLKLDLPLPEPDPDGDYTI